MRDLNSDLSQKTYVFGNSIIDSRHPFLSAHVDKYLTESNTWKLKPKYYKRILKLKSFPNNLVTFKFFTPLFQSLQKNNLHRFEPRKMQKVVLSVFIP